MISDKRSALISDFDGTITQNDFYLLIAERYMHGDPLAVWERHRAGEISHLDAMQYFFSHAPDDPSALDRLLQDVNVDERIEEASLALLGSGWDLIIVSAGSSWYIDRILKARGVNAIVHANPGLWPAAVWSCESPWNPRFFALTSASTNQPWCARRWGATI